VEKFLKALNKKAPERVWEKVLPGWHIILMKGIDGGEGPESSEGDA
jgi:hypothetical protein